MITLKSKTRKNNKKLEKITEIELKSKKRSSRKFPKKQSLDVIW